MHENPYPKMDTIDERTLCNSVIQNPKKELEQLPPTIEKKG